MKGKFLTEVLCLKEFKTLFQQIQQLTLRKNIHFSNVEHAKTFLVDNNYSNVISCGKVKFLNGYSEGRSFYEASTFQDWIDYYHKDVQVSLYLADAMLKFEKTLNSRTAYYVSLLFETESELPDKIKSDLTRVIRNSKVSSLPTYEGHETWRYITNMEFGKMKRILYFLNDHKHLPQLSEALEEILNETKLDKKRLSIQLNDLNNLRNHLFHFTPLNIFISYGTTGHKNNTRLSNRRRKQAVHYIFSLNPDNTIKTILEEFYRNSDHFIKSKNSQQ
jgi:hypothetical protein